MEQTLAWYLSLLFIGLVAAVFLWVRLHSRETAEFAPIRDRAYRLRPHLFWALVVVGIPVMVVTLMMTPYESAQGLPDDALHVDVQGQQFAWTLSETGARAGQTVVFNVTSADVNHGFGIYDADMRLVAQTQAMPGYSNRLVHVFEKPGSYRILCLEYCGMAHHVMEARFEITEAR